MAPLPPAGRKISYFGPFDSDKHPPKIARIKKTESVQITGPLEELLGFAESNGLLSPFFNGNLTVVAAPLTGAHTAASQAYHGHPSAFHVHSLSIAVCAWFTMVCFRLDIIERSIWLSPKVVRGRSRRERRLALHSAMISACRCFIKILKK